jgi:hypothetical protein
MAAGVLGSLWATGYGIQHLGVGQLDVAHASAMSQVTRAMGVAPSMWTYLTLGSILVAVECGCWWFVRTGQIQHASEGS